MTEENNQPPSDTPVTCRWAGQIYQQGDRVCDTGEWLECRADGHWHKTGDPCSPSVPDEEPHEDS